MPKNGRRKAKIGRPRAPRSFIDRLKAISVGDAAAGAVQVYRAASHALLAWNSEVKYVDTSVPRVATTWNGTIYPISLLAQGATSVTRDGNSVRARGLELKWTIISAAATINFGRTIVFIDHEGQGVLPVIADLLTAVGTAESPSSPWNLLNGRQRYEVLYDSGPVGVDPAGRLSSSHSEVIPVNHHVLYNGAAGTIAEAREGSLFVCQVADIAAAGPTMGFYSRLHFVDN